MPDVSLEHVHVEPSEPGDGSAPAVILLHDRSSSEQDLLSTAQGFSGRAHVVSLRAPDRLQGGHTWYELDLLEGGLYESQLHAEQFERSWNLAREVVTGAAEAYDIDPDRISLLGFSQGVITNLSLPLNDLDNYTWVVALHGYLTNSHADLDPDGIADKPVFVNDGLMDQIIPTSWAEHAAERLRELSADTTMNAYNMPHGIGPNELQDMVAFADAHV